MDRSELSLKHCLLVWRKTVRMWFVPFSDPYIYIYVENMLATICLCTSTPFLQLQLNQRSNRLPDSYISQQDFQVMVCQIYIFKTTFLVSLFLFYGTIGILKSAGTLCVAFKVTVILTGALQFTIVSARLLLQ